jgi:hypothetical protein
VCCRDCDLQRCEEGKCRIGLPPGNAPRICIRGTRYQTNHGFGEPLCDCVIFYDNDGKLTVIAAELKSGYFEATKVAAQLQGGADIAQVMIPEGGKASFIALLAHRGGIDATTVKAR